jgi:hypothetical protein
MRSPRRGDHRHQRAAGGFCIGNDAVIVYWLWSIVV